MLRETDELECNLVAYICIYLFISSIPLIYRLVSEIVFYCKHLKHFVAWVEISNMYSRNILYLAFITLELSIQLSTADLTEVIFVSYLEYHLQVLSYLIYVTSVF